MTMTPKPLPCGHTAARPDCETCSDLYWAGYEPWKDDMPEQDEPDFG